MGEGYEFTPLGPVPLGEGQAVWNRLGGADHVAGGAVDVAASEESATDMADAALVRRAAIAHRPAQPQAVEPARPAAAAPVTARTLLAGARKRIRELDALLRRMPALQAERDGLARLVAVASPPSPRSTRREDPAVIKATAFLAS